MPNQKNQEQYQALSTQLQNSTGVVFVDYKGLTHNQLEELRNAINEAGGDLHITKNTLLKIAVTDTENTTKASEEANQHLTGPTATLFLRDEIVAPIKVLAEFIEQYELPVVKGGILEEVYIDESKVTQLSKLPSYEELIAQVMARLNAPATNLALVLKATSRNLVYALQAIKEQKEGGDTNG